MEVISDVIRAVSGEQWWQEPLRSKLKRRIGEEENSFEKGTARVRLGPEGGDVSGREMFEHVCVLMGKTSPEEEID